MSPSPYTARCRRRGLAVFEILLVLALVLVLGTSASLIWAHRTNRPSLRVPEGTPTARINTNPAPTTPPTDGGLRRTEELSSLVVMLANSNYPVVFARQGQEDRWLAGNGESLTSEQIVPLIRQGVIREMSDEEIQRIDNLLNDAMADLDRVTNSMGASMEAAMQRMANQIERMGQQIGRATGQTGWQITTTTSPATQQAPAPAPKQAPKAPASPEPKTRYQRLLADDDDDLV